MAVAENHTLKLQKLMITASNCKKSYNFATTCSLNKLKKLEK